jgi:hypothetical protein
MWIFSNALGRWSPLARAIEDVAMGGREEEIVYFIVLSMSYIRMSMEELAQVPCHCEKQLLP